METTEFITPSTIWTNDFDPKVWLSFSLFFLVHIETLLLLGHLIGRLWHEWAAFSQPLIFLKFSSVPRHACHICHLQPPTGKTLFRTDIRTFWRSYQYCSESVLACTAALFVILINHQQQQKRSACCRCSHPKRNGHQLSVWVSH